MSRAKKEKQQKLIDEALKLYKKQGFNEALYFIYEHTNGFNQSGKYHIINRLSPNGIMPRWYAVKTANNQNVVLTPNEVFPNHGELSTLKREAIHSMYHNYMMSSTQPVQPEKLSIKDSLDMHEAVSEAKKLKAEQSAVFEYEENPFFAMIDRMRYIERWSLMRSSVKENLMEHSFETAMLTHILCEIGNRIFNKHYDTKTAVLVAMYHDVNEVITGDMPTPVKYLNSDIKTTYKQIEVQARKHLYDMLPDVLKPAFNELLIDDGSVKQDIKYIVKCADKLSAYLQCVREQSTGNKEFSDAKVSILKGIEEMESVEVLYFLRHFKEPYKKTLDMLKK